MHDSYLITRLLTLSVRLGRESKLLSAVKDISKIMCIRTLNLSLITEYRCSRPEDGLDSIRVECTLQNYPADSDTLQLAQLGLGGLISTLSSLSLFVNASDVISGKQVLALYSSDGVL